MTLSDTQNILSQVSRYCKDNQPARAIAVLQQAVAEGLTDPRITGNLGTLLFQAGQHTEGLRYLEQACQQAEVETDHLINLGYCLKYTGQFTRALEVFDRAAQREPDQARLRWHRALLRLLLNREWPQALDDYEYRWQVSDFPDKPRQYAQPVWAGAADRRLTVLVYSEQGFGDTLQYLRYVPEIAARVGRVILEIQPELLRLIQYQQQIGHAVIPATVTVVAHNTAEPLPPFDQQIALLSLPRALQQFDFSHPPLPSAYLAAPGRLHIERDADGKPRKVIGLIWAGRATHPKDAIRSFSLTDCAPLWRVPDIQWISLQKGRPASDLADWQGSPLLDMSEHLTDFYETARIMRNLDAVITADTATAHLAAALGIPTWIAINPIPDWRWGLNTAESPWYQSVRLFRQSQVGQWQDVFEAMARVLEEGEREKIPAPSPATLAQTVDGLLRKTLQDYPELGTAELENLLRLLAKWRHQLLSNTWIAHQGNTVQSGPFAGLRFIGQPSEGCSAPRLLGCYEHELHPHIERLAARDFEVVLNIGCADGYYAVGLATRMPSVHVHAHDTNPKAQAHCQAVAELNGVAHRISIGGLFQGSDFDHFKDRKTWLIMDIEGGEQALLNPEAYPVLQQMTVLVECHDCFTPGLTDEITRRFTPTHHITRIEHGFPSPELPEWLKGLSHLDQLLTVWEWRTGPTPWLVMEPLE